MRDEKCGSRDVRVRTQVRLPDDVYYGVRYVAAGLDMSFNAAVIFLLREALEGHRELIPNLQSSQTAR